MVFNVMKLSAKLLMWKLLQQKRCQALTLAPIGQPLENETDTWTPDSEIDHLAAEIGAVILIQCNVIHICEFKLRFV